MLISLLTQAHSINSKQSEDMYGSFVHTAYSPTSSVPALDTQPVVVFVSLSTTLYHEGLPRWGCSIILILNICSVAMLLVGIMSYPAPLMFCNEEVRNREVS